MGSFHFFTSKNEGRNYYVRVILAPPKEIEHSLSEHDALDREYAYFIQYDFIFLKVFTFRSVKKQITPLLYTEDTIEGIFIPLSLWWCRAIVRNTFIPVIKSHNDLDGAIENSQLFPGSPQFESTLSNNFLGLKFLTSHNISRKISEWKLKDSSKDNVLQYLELQRPMAKALRVNCRLCISLYPWFVDQIKSENPDIIGFQEVRFRFEASAGKEPYTFGHQVEDLARQLPRYQYVYKPGILHEENELTR